MMDFATFMIEHIDDPPILSSIQWNAMKKAYQQAINQKKLAWIKETREKLPKEDYDYCGHGFNDAIDECQDVLRDMQTETEAAIAQEVFKNSS